MISDKELYREEMWKRMEHFETVDDIPSLPTAVPEEKWKNFYIPILIKCGAIPKRKLINGAYYNGSCRNTEIAMWDGFVDLTINYHTVILRTVEYSSIEIF